MRQKWADKRVWGEELGKRQEGRPYKDGSRGPDSCLSAGRLRIF